MLRQAEIKVIEKHAYKEFVPTLEFSRELMEYAKEVAEKKEKLRYSAEMRNVSLAKYNDCEEKNQNFKIIESAGGIEEVGREYTKKKSRIKKFKVLKIISAALIILAVIGTAPLYFFDIYKNLIIPGGISALFILFTVIFSLTEKQAKRDIVEYYESYDFKAESDFAYVLDDYPDTESQLSILRNDLEKCEADYLEKENAFDEVYTNARQLLLKWNRTPESDEKKAEDFIKYANLASEAAEEIQKAKSSYEQGRQKLEFALEGVDERALRKLAAAARKPNYDEKHIIRELDFLTSANEKMREKGYEHGRNRAAAKLPDPVILQSQITFVEEKITDLAMKQNALALAIDTLTKSCAELRNNVSPALSRSAGESFKIITGGKYGELFVNKKLELKAEVDSNALSREIEYLSAGTRDAAYLCLRMALLDLLFDNEMPPLICDESFLRFDSSRLENLIKVLISLSRKTQIFIFTCHEREVSFLNKITEAAVVSMKT